MPPAIIPHTPHSAYQAAKSRPVERPPPRSGGPSPACVSAKQTSRKTNISQNKQKLEARISTNSLPPGSVCLGARHEHISLGKVSTEELFETELTIEVIEPMGWDTLVWSKPGCLNFRFRVDGQTKLKTGDRQVVHFDPERASIFDQDSELRI